MKISKIKEETVAGITYKLPQVALLHHTPLWTAEAAARTAYGSFAHSEHEDIRSWDGESIIEDIDSSEILDSLAWVHFHHSVLELINFTFSIKGISRGVLVEHSRHRHQSLTVKSTRYTMSSLINLFLADMLHNYANTIPSPWFLDEGLKLDLFVTSEPGYNEMQLIDIWHKLKYQWKSLGESAFLDISTTKSIRAAYEDYAQNHKHFYSAANQAKQKRNVFDNFKHVINDNVSTDLVMTINLRSLKNFLDLRANGAAWFQIQWLAEAIKSAVPDKFIKLIEKRN